MSKPPLPSCLWEVIDSLSADELKQFNRYAFNTLKRCGLIGSPQPIVGDEGQHINIVTPTVSPEEAEDLPNKAIELILDGTRGKKYWNNGFDPCNKKDVVTVIKKVISSLVGNRYQELHDRDFNDGSSDQNYLPPSRMHSHDGLPEHDAAVEQALEMAEEHFSKPKEKCVINTYIGPPARNREEIAKLCNTSESTVQRILERFREFLEDKLQCYTY